MAIVEKNSLFIPPTASRCNEQSVNQQECDADIESAARSAIQRHQSAFVWIQGFR